MHIMAQTLDKLAALGGIAVGSSVNVKLASILLNACKFFQGFLPLIFTIYSVTRTFLI